LSWTELPPQVPTAGNALTRGFCRGLLKLAGWRVESNFPNVPKAMVIVAPHTSNWDWVIGILVVFGLGLRITWLGKHTLFQGPFAWFFYGLGGTPVDRGAAAGIVDQVVAEYGRREQMLYGLAPEGTRSAGSRFRSGYHHIARGADVPLVLAAFDYPSRTLTVGEVFPLSDDVRADSKRLQAWYQQFEGRRSSSNRQR
jgi:1-acyl-sn-glycerol-3-phosphate acyltransferase